jgi:hypothetical protein
MPPLPRHVLVLVALAAATAGSTLLAQKGTTLPTGLSLPKSAKKALDDHLKGWAMAPIDPQASACRRDGEASPAFVQADFDGDGQQDIAVAVKVGDDVRLVAILARMEQSQLVNVDSLGQGAASAYLGIEKRGTKFKDPQYGLDDFLSADTLAVYRCGQSTTAYIWAGSGFIKVVMP